jgi:probable rRNA maturation factor
MLLGGLRVTDNGWAAAWGGDREAFARGVLEAAAAAEGAEGEVSVLLAAAEDVRRLNRLHRGEDKATNVLAFPAAASAGALLGDIALAYDEAAAEAAAQGKDFSAHAAHLLTHGFLHLLGYDHIDDADAERMEGRERVILAALGAGDPYAAELA